MTKESGGHQYPPGVTLRPLTIWPSPATPVEDRRRATFDSSFSDTMVLLQRELKMYDKRDHDWPTTVLQIAIRENDLRKDGLLRASATPTHSGIILSVEPKYKPRLLLPCDTFTHWHDNVRAVALTLEALRKIERYGAALNDEQYRGWQALPLGVNSIVQGDTIAEFPTPETALRFISQLVGAPYRGRPSGELVSNVFTRARHKDGDTALSDKIERAGRVLEAHEWL